MRLGAREPGSPQCAGNSPTCGMSAGGPGLGTCHAAVSLLPTQPLARKAQPQQRQPSVRVSSCPQAASTCLLAHRPCWDTKSQCIPLHLAGIVVQTCLEHQEPDTSQRTLSPPPRLSASSHGMISQLVSARTTCLCFLYR